MHGWIILPYDGSPVARAALRRAAQVVGRGTGRYRYAGLILATAGVDPAAIDNVMLDVREIAGPDIPLELWLLNPGDPLGALRELAGALPDATFAAPLGGAGAAPWYVEACRHGGRDHTTILFFLAPAEIHAFAGRNDVRLGGTGLAGALRRAGARLRPGAEAPAARSGSYRPSTRF
jgi:hypothetical protein